MRIYQADRKIYDNRKNVELHYRKQTEKVNV